MTQLDMIDDAIANMEATVEAAKAPLEPGPIAHATTGKLAKTLSVSRPVRPTQTVSTTKRPRPAKTPRSKKAVLQALVERKHGATIVAMMGATGWQAHSVRAGLTGLRKAGLALERRTNRKGEMVYSAPQPAQQ